MCVSCPLIVAGNTLFCLLQGNDGYGDAAELPRLAMLEQGLLCWECMHHWRRGTCEGR